MTSYAKAEGIFVSVFCFLRYLDSETCDLEGDKVEVWSNSQKAREDLSLKQSQSWQQNVVHFLGSDSSWRDSSSWIVQA